MTHRERILNCLHYRDYDRLPILHFGFWGETLQKWHAEGHLTCEEATGWGDGNPIDGRISKKLGFDANWSLAVGPHMHLRPTFESRDVEVLPDGSRKVLNGEGVVVLVNADANGIPAEIEHTLVDRASWEKHYKWRYDYAPERILGSVVNVNGQSVGWTAGGLDYLRQDPATRPYPIAIFCGSYYGYFRNITGVTGSSYIYADDPDLFQEIIDTIGGLSYRCVKEMLDSGARFDFGHMWEDICFKSGPLVSPAVFRDYVAPHYRRLTDLLADHGIDIVSLDCDGKIDALVPIWLEHGVNTMFPIEVGTWDASIAPWRARYGQAVRGVGGMNKVVFSRDRDAVDAEVERLRPLVELGGYIPCPDHRIPPDGKWDLVQYYCQRLRETFAG